MSNEEERPMTSKSNGSEAPEEEENEYEEEEEEEQEEEQQEPAAEASQPSSQPEPAAQPQPTTKLTKEIIAPGLSQLARTADGLSHAFVRLELRGHQPPIDDIDQLKAYQHIRYIDLSDNKIVNFTAALAPLEHLITLNVESNQIQNIDVGTKNFLQIANFAKNRIRNIPELDLPLLRDLNLNYNIIEEVSGIDKLEHLKQLSLRGNKLKNTNGINAPNIRNLYLAENSIDTINLELKEIERLHLRKNQISSLAGLENLQSVTYLNLRDNLISDINELEKLKELKNLKSLVLAGNPIAKNEQYRMDVLIILPQLKRLDKQDFEEEDYEEAKDIEEERKAKAIAEAQAKAAEEALKKAQEAAEEEEDEEEGESSEEEGGATTTEGEEVEESENPDDSEEEEEN